jgi:hypothetical protein
VEPLVAVGAREGWEIQNNAVHRSEITTRRNPPLFRLCPRLQRRIWIKPLANRQTLAEVQGAVLCRSLNVSFNVGMRLASAYRVETSKWRIRNTPSIGRPQRPGG